MAHRLTLREIRNSRFFQESSNLQCDSAAIVSAINDAQSVLLRAGLWHGTFQRYKFCITDSCIRTPPHIARLIRMQTTCEKIDVQGDFFQFSDFVNPDTCCGSSGTCADWAIAQGDYATFEEISGEAKFLRFYLERNEDVGKRVLVKGYDENEQWIRSTEDGAVIDGVYVTMALPYVTSTQLFSQVTGIQTTETRSGNINVWSLNQAGTQSRSIAILYPQWESTSYRQYRITGETPSCRNGQIEAIVKLDFYPMVRDTDYSIIQSIEAYAHMARSLRLDAAEAPGEAEAYRAKAIRALNDEIKHYYGNERTIQVQVHGRAPLSRRRIGNMR